MNHGVFLHFAQMEAFFLETELFAQTYKGYGLATVRYPVLEVTGTVEPFENGRGFTLRVLRARKSQLIKTQ